MPTAAESTAEEPLLELRHLRTYFHTPAGTVRAVDDLTLSLERGHTLGLVGESGSGKSVTSLSIMRLLDAAAAIEGGEISFLGKDLVRLPARQMRRLRGQDISMIFQEPGKSLNPVFRVGRQVMECIRTHNRVSKSEARRRTVELFEEVGIPDPARRIDSYPHEMSGGQKQRVMIAMALSCNPQLLIADEPTTALDVTIQAQVLDLIRRLRDDRGMAVLFITHDLGVIGEVADDVAVMYQGKLVETGPVERIFAAPRHPYTKGLLACRPRLDTPYRRLPTVADFMDVTAGADGPAIVEKPMTDQRRQALRTTGRGRLLHPKDELARLGHPVEESDWPADTQWVRPNTQPALQVRDLHVHYPVRQGIFRRQVDVVRAVDGISFDVYPGQTLGLVGESGCGKTTASRAILRLIPVTGGTVEFKGQDLARASASWLRRLRREIQIVFQDPYGSLNPRLTVQSALTEAMTIHGLGTGRSDRRDRAAELLVKVGLEPGHLSRYPHEFSGGQRQRICIARALAVEPSFIICDESVSALDVSVQAQVLNLLKDLQEEMGLTYVFISHDLSVVKFMSDMMAVMKDGRVVEFGPSESIYRDPQQAYTKRLLAAIPDDSLDNVRRRVAERAAKRR